MTARLLADEHIDLRVVRALRLLGHDVVHAHQHLKSDARDTGPEDDVLLELALADQRALVTDNVKISDCCTAKAAGTPASLPAFEMTSIQSGRRKPLIEPFATHCATSGASPAN